MQRWEKLIITMTFLVLSASLGVSRSQAQHPFDRKENITVLPFSGANRWIGEAMMDKMITHLVKMKRFNVIDRTHLSKILDEQKLQLTDIVDERTAVRIGNIAGVSKLIVGQFRKVTLEDVETKSTSPSYYRAKAEVSIKMLDVESARYIQATEATGIGSDYNEEKALLEAFDDVGKNVITAFEELLAIKGAITSVDKSVVIIDKGASFGVNKGMNFSVLNVQKADVSRSADIDAETGQVAFLRIISVEENSSRGRLMSVTGTVRPGLVVRETKEEVFLEGSVVKKDWGKVTLNMGREMGMKEGKTFKVIETGEEVIDPMTGESFGFEQKVKGIISITDVYSTFSEAKVIRGRYSIKKGMTVKEASQFTMGWTVGFLYTTAPLYASKKNNNAWEGTVSVAYTGSHDVSVDYSGISDLTVASIGTIYIGKLNKVKNYYVGFYATMIVFPDDYLEHGFVLGANCSYHIGVIPELLYIYPGIGVGIGSITQEAQRGLVDELSNGESGVLDSSSFDLHVKVGARLEFAGHFNIFAELDYRYLEFKNWTINVRTGVEDGKVQTESVDVPDQIVPYPKVSLAGPNVSIGIAWEF